MNDKDALEDEGPIFTVRLLIKHPSWDPSDLTRDLGLTPQLAHRVGDPRRTPKGQPLTGVYREMVWSHWNKVTGSRRFLESAEALIATLERQGDLLRRLSETGGTATPCFDLRGEWNIGDVLGWRDLGRLAAMRVDLSVEIFP